RLREGDLPHPSERRTDRRHRGGDRRFDPGAGRDAPLVRPVGDTDDPGDPALPRSSRLGSAIHGKRCRERLPADLHGTAAARPRRGTSARAIVLDIEGTTTPNAFVEDVLFPFVRRSAAAFLAEHRHEPEVEADLALLAEERARESPDVAPPPESSDPLPYLFWLMDRDRKSTALKALQGRMWRDGYESGALVGQV